MLCDMTDFNAVIRRYIDIWNERDLREMEDHVAAWRRTPGFEEAEVPSGDLRLKREVQLGQMAALAPGAKKLTNGLKGGRCAHVLVTLRRSRVAAP